MAPKIDINVPDSNMHITDPSSGVQEISINTYTYNIYKDVIKRYFVIGIIDNPRYTDVYAFTLEHNGIQASKEVCDNIVYSLMTDFKEDVIRKDTINHVFYTEFTKAHLTISLIDVGIERARNIKLALEDVRNWLGIHGKDPVHYYNSIRFAFVNLVKKTIPKEVLRVDIEENNRNTHYTCYNRTLHIALDKTSHMTRPYLYMVIKDGYNLYDEVRRVLNMTDEECEFYGIDLAEYRMSDACV